MLEELRDFSGKILVLNHVGERVEVMERGYSMEPMNLGSEELRALVLQASSEASIVQQRLTKDEEPGAVTFEASSSLVDGWQTRRRQGRGHDWVVLRLGVPGIVDECLIDTTGFEHTCPSEISIEGCVAPHNTRCDDLQNWTELVARANVVGGKKNSYSVDSRERFTHIRLNIFPDGGVARLRVFGVPIPAWMGPGKNEGRDIDLVARSQGGSVFFLSEGSLEARQDLIMPGLRGGWRTRRRRELGSEWVVLRLVGPSNISALTLDTAGLGADCPDKAWVEASTVSDPGDEDWFELLPPQLVLTDTEHTFQEELRPNSELLWLRLHVAPDGGMTRLRAWGSLTESGLTQARLAFLNSASKSLLATLFKQVCHSDRWSEAMSRSRPFLDLNDLLSKGEAAWAKCEEEDWKQALDGHPRIGDKAKGNSLAAKWSKGEQSKAQKTDESVLERLREAQDQYFEKFGFIFLICASGLGSQEILAATEQRLENSPDHELKLVAREQAKITQLRLEKLLKS